MSKSTKYILLYGVIAYFLYKKLLTGGLSGIDGLGAYPVPGSRPGYYSSSAYSQWYTGQFLPWYYRSYGTYPPAYMAYYQQQGMQANLYSQDSSGQYYIDPGSPTPIQAPVQQSYYGYPSYQYPYGGYGYPQAHYVPGQVDPNFPM